MSLRYFSVANAEQFQYLMYRPLYWFGQGRQATLDEASSLADPPTYSGNTVTVTLKPYRWSNGEPLTATDVMFWMNMLHAEKKNWAAYAPGTIPDDLSNVVADSPTQLTFTLSQPVNSSWFTNNQLSQITPLPVAWDIASARGSAGSGGCANAPYGAGDLQCTRVYTFLSKQAGYDPANPKAPNNALSTYASNKLWQVVDGPWHLTHFDASGNVTFGANTSYSGSVRPTLNTFRELPFTSDSAELDALASGKVDVGFLPTADVTAGTGNPLVPGPNIPRLRGRFTLDPLYTWSVNYFPYNFDSTGNGGNAGPVFRQLYFRQAVQYLVDQPLYIRRIFKGYGVPSYGPVPIAPANPYASTVEKSNPYPYDPARARALLQAHGWKVVPDGVDTCRRPGSGPSECGAGIRAGAQLDFQLQYAPSAAWVTPVMEAERSSWARAGINVDLSQASFSTVIGTAVPCPKGCPWQLENWGAGWVFSPGYYPTGEEIFQSGAGSNSGNYSDPLADALIRGTISTDGTSLSPYENYVAEQLPVVWQPNAVTELTEIHKGLSGVTPQNVLWALTPENWRWSR